MTQRIKTKGKNKGKRGYGWPDFRNRWCTALKREAFKKEVYGKVKKTPLNVFEYHGIAADELDRIGKNNDGRFILTPLVNWGVTEKAALEYCYSKGFNWGGLYETMARVSCYCCPLSRFGELQTVHDNYPKLWANMVDLDNNSYRSFQSGRSLTQLTDRFKYCLYK